MEEITIDGFRVSKKIQVEQYLAILSHGPTWTGNLISKLARSALVAQGYIYWDKLAVDCRHRTPGAYVAISATLRWLPQCQQTGSRPLVRLQAGRLNTSANDMIVEL